MPTQDQQAVPCDFQVIKQEVDDTYVAQVSVGFDNHEDAQRCYAELEIMLTGSEMERGYQPVEYGLFHHEKANKFVCRIREVGHPEEFDAEIALLRIRRLMSEIAREVSTDAAD